MAKTEQVWTYTGRWPGTKNAVVHGYVDAEDVERFFSHPLTTCTVIGARVRVEADDGTATRFKNESRYVDMSADVRVPDWQLNDASIGAELLLRKRANREATTDPLAAMTLAELRRELPMMNRPRRQATVAAVLDYIYGR